MSHDSVTTNGVENKYPHACEDLIKTIKFRDPKHTPNNKRSHEVDSTGILEVYQHIKADWFTFNFTEVTTYPGSGKVTERVMSITIPRAMAEQLAEFIKAKY